MMKLLITMAVLFMLAGSALGTMWLYDDPSFFMIGSQFKAPSFHLNNVSPIDIIKAPYFPLLGQGFYRNPIPVQLTNSSDAIQIGVKANLQAAPVQITFGGHLEDNLKYAQTRSSLRVGQQGSWTNLNTPGVL